MAFALHLKHHAKFYAAAVLGVLVWLATAPLEAFMRILLAGDVFFLAHLLALAVLLSISREGTFRRRAEQEDDGIGLIALITIAALTLSLGSIFGYSCDRRERCRNTFALGVYQAGPQGAP